MKSCSDFTNIKTIKMKKKFSFLLKMYFNKIIVYIIHIL